jgi:hypothetical protein
MKARARTQVKNSAAQWVADWQAVPRFWLLAGLFVIAGASFLGMSLGGKSSRPVAVLVADGAASGDLLLPGLLNRLNDVQKVVLADTGGSLTLYRRGDSWQLGSESGAADFPVNAGMLREQLFNLARLEVVEAKTTNPKLYERLHVEPLTARGSKAREVQLLDGAGKPIAALLMGKTEQTRNGQLSRQFYVRPAGKAQAWLVRGTAQWPMEARAWFDRDLLHVEPSRWKTLQLNEAAPLSRTSPYASSNAAALQLFSAVQWQDIRPRSEVAAAPMAAKVTGSTFDGMELTLTLHRYDGGLWAVLTPSWRVAPHPETFALQQKSEKNSARATGLLTPDAVRADVAELQQRSAAWAFQLPRRVTDALLAPAVTTANAKP